MTSAFKAARSRTRGWRRIADKNVRHRWDLACKCKRSLHSADAGVEATVYVDPAYYADNGIPVCEKCGVGRNYVRTEVR